MKLIMGVFAALFTISLIPSGAWAVEYGTPNRPAVNPLTGQSSRANVDMQEDMRALEKQVKELMLRVELLEGQKAQLEQQLADSKPDTSTFVTRQELKLLEQRLYDYANVEDQKTRDQILSEIRSIAQNTRYNVSEPEAVRSSVAATPERDESFIVSDAEKQRYMREGVRHVVQGGDTLSGIARRYRSSVRAIRAVNNIADPNRLFVGMELFVPTSIQ